MKKTTIGGSALIEGLLMIGPKNAAIAVRKPDDEIITELRDLPKRDKLTKIPVIRGIVNFFRQMILVVKALMFSAKFFDLESEENHGNSLADKFDRWLEKKLGKVFGDKAIEWIVYFSVALSLVVSVGLFILLPNFLAGLLGLAVDKKEAASQFFSWRVVFLNLFEGTLKLTFFFVYVWLASKMEDIKRVWQYHGAEHKTIFCYEQGEELTVENVRKYSTKHPRCGTSFMILVLLLSIILFSFTGWNSIWLNLLIRLSLVPLIAGLSYELLKFAGRRSDSKFMKIINAPGLAFQRLTTKEPDDDQIEVAVVAMKNVIVEDEKADEW